MNDILSPKELKNYEFSRPMFPRALQTTTLRTAALHLSQIISDIYFN